MDGDMNNGNINSSGMDERELSTALEEIADEIVVSEVPLQQIKESRQDARRSWRTPLLAAAAVALVAGVGVPVGLSWWQDHGHVSNMPGEVTLGPDQGLGGGPDEGPTDGLDVAPGARLVGIGQVAIEVPAGWGTNQSRCFTPQRSTLVIDSTDFCFAYIPRQAGIETVEVQPLQAVADLLGEPVHEETFLGVDTTRWETTCSDNEYHVRKFDAEPVQVCTAQVWLHGDDDVQFRATAATVERAEELLATIRRVPGHIGLVGPADFTRYDLRMSEKSTAEVADAYVAHLRNQGLDAILRTEGDPQDPAATIQVSPEPGTLLLPGVRVKVTLGAVGG